MNDLKLTDSGFSTAIDKLTDGYALNKRNRVRIIICKLKIF